MNVVNTTYGILLVLWRVTEFYNTYAVLLLNSLGLQDAIERSPINLPHFFSRCLKAASDCAKCIRDELGPRGYLRYSPLSHFIEGSYAVLTLLKVLIHLMFTQLSLIE